MLNVSEIATSTEERVLTGVKVTQAFVLDGIKNTLALADRVVPAQVTDRIEERVSVIPSASPVIHGAFDFAGKLLAAQRDFAGEMIEIFQPAPAKKAAPKAAPKAAAKKAPAKRTAKKAA
jgi:hypothetical protein